MRHLTLHISAALSLLIGVLTIAAWIASIRWPASHNLDFYPSDALAYGVADSYFIAYAHGTLILGNNGPTTIPQGSSVMSYAYREPHKYSLQLLQQHPTLKFSFFSGQIGRSAESYSGIIVPCWFVILLSIPIPVRWYFFYKKR